MAWSRACCLLVWPRGVTKEEIEAIDKDLKYFVANCYDKIDRETAKRWPLCLSASATPLAIVPLRWADGPAWVV